MPSNVVHKWCDGVRERFRGVRRVSVGRLRVSEVVLQFVGISGVRCCFGGDWRSLWVYLGGNEIRSKLLGGFWGFF